MAHRRLVLAFALTIGLALLLALLVVTSSPGRSLALPVPIATSAVESSLPMLHSGPPDRLDELAAGRRVWDNAVRWFAEAKRQEDERAAQAASAESARRTDRTGSPSASTLPAPAPVPSGDALEAIAAHFADLYDSAVGVARCESTLNPAAVSAGGGNWGLFQINRVHRDSFEAVTGRPWSDVLNADANAQFARWLYDSSGGWGPWACKWAA